jgi:hypothetical protein
MHIKFYFGKTESKRPFGEPRLRQKNYTKINLTDVGRHLIRVPHDRVQRWITMNTITNLCVL